MWPSVKWLCGLVAISCNPVPDIAAIQTAYEREASAGSALHDKDLQVLQTKCHDDSSDKFLCEVTLYREAIRRSASTSTSSPSLAQARAGNSRADCASADAPGSA